MSVEMDSGIGEDLLPHWQVVHFTRHLKRKLVLGSIEIFKNESSFNVLVTMLLVAYKYLSKIVSTIRQCYSHLIHLLVFNKYYAPSHALHYLPN